MLIPIAGQWIFVYCAEATFLDNRTWEKKLFYYTESFNLRPVRSRSVPPKKPPQLVHILTQKALITLHHSFAHSHLQYCPLIMYTVHGKNIQNAKNQFESSAIQTTMLTLKQFSPHSTYFLNIKSFINQNSCIITMHQ